jgi:hypothetical protein
MKNVHLLPTDKPSRLLKTIPKGNLILSKSITSGSHWENQNIYITNSEEIKGDWFLTFLNGEVIGKPRRCEDSNYNFSGCKKIILTTDQDLIKDGVQAIDDTFLEWFVNNPNCENVEVELHEVSFVITDNIYKIIIPQEEPKCWECKGVIKDGICFCNREEPKQECLHQESRFRDYYKDGCYKCWECGKIVVEEPKQTDEKGKPLTYWGGLEEPKQEKERGLIIQKSDGSMIKQETLEEAAEKYVKSDLKKTPLYWLFHDTFKDGAKWQAKRMYSEEEIAIAFNEGQAYSVTGKLVDGKEWVKTHKKEWFEQLKIK